jgi:hypothetical protein
MVDQEYDGNRRQQSVAVYVGLPAGGARRRAEPTS